MPCFKLERLLLSVPSTLLYMCQVRLGTYPWTFTRVSSSLVHNYKVRAKVAGRDKRTSLLHLSIPIAVYGKLYGL